MAAPHPIRLPWSTRWLIYQRRRRGRAATWRTRWADVVFLVIG